MGVCTVERPVMHWQQSARFLGPPRERSPSLPGPLNNSCNVGNNNHPLHRPCSSCPEQCEHSSKHFGPSPIFNESCRSYETPERTIFDDSGMGFLDSSSRVECTEMRSGGTSCLELKSEPMGPSSPESSSEILTGPDDCAGCGRLIQDRFFLQAVEKRWHVGCLRCCVCSQLLESETSCFSRDGNIYCKSDYYRVFQSTRRCSKCMASISSSELVMRARHLVFHIRCFSCAVCNTPLTKGDQFGMRTDLVFCRLHYEISLESTSTAPTPLTLSCQYSQYGSSPNGPSSPSDISMKVGSAGFFNSTPHGVPGLPQPPRQKGRPRKRKPKDIESMTANLELNSEYLDLGYGRGSHMSASSRAKRMRTSFKHHQLRTMKSYFAINHNPDAKDLKQLSQKTGLPKRVLQVWFQNARAKWRRMMMKQEGKGGGSEKGDGSLDLDSYSHSPTYMLGGGPPSPNSID
ncbi:protein apterous-like isoform X1 [Bradysia coprophila]|uniref:protein apterous-like isoform X1 n=1 Tax=Bradysia coprophila TaxID=38358 RepID=UPI00187DC3F3|nr:protein apterous-like isoform X1 [Bradysia coprophila]